MMMQHIIGAIVHYSSPYATIPSATQVAAQEGGLSPPG